MPKLKVNDIEMYYQIEGKGPPLVFIHGLGSSSMDWEEQIPEFSKDFQVIGVDLRGHGQSDFPMGSYNIDSFASDVAALLRKLSMMPAHVVGLSMGSAVAWHLALDYPETVRTLVITNMAAEVPVTGMAAKWMFYFRVILRYHAT